MQDVINISKAVFFSSIAFLTCMAFIFWLHGFPRSVLIMDGIMTFLLLCGVRMLVRIHRENLRTAKNSRKGEDVLIAGAGSAGVIILSEIRMNPEIRQHPVGFVDDNPYKKGSTIQGLPVLGSCSEIPDLAAKYDIDEVLICMPSAAQKDLHRIYEICKKAEIKFRTLSSLSVLFNGNGLFNHLQEVPFDDLLGRSITRFRQQEDIELLGNDITGHNILITGAGGSIGSELARQTAHLQPQTLILYERGENYLYHLEMDLRREFPEQNIIPVIGDILDEKKFDTVLKTYKPNLIYHAAAYKHVPMMERNPLEAVRNNVLGTHLITRIAMKYQVPKFVLISTDKAVRPANIMGTTKRVAELLLQGLNGNGTKFISVRFGNVIGSNGSVVPLFKRQIAEGGPVTVTHTEVSRYFMAISEAVQLVMLGGAMGEGGEIFLLDMGKPIKILDLAVDLIKRSGLEPGKDIDIVFNGLRPGEKLHEELYWQGERIIPTPNKKITMLEGDGLYSDLVLGSIDRLQECVNRLDEQGATEILKMLVPEATIENHVQKTQNLELIVHS